MWDDESMPSVSANGLTLEYERAGSGPPMLLVMGLGAQLTSWPPELIEALVARGFDVIRIRNRRLVCRPINRFICCRCRVRCGLGKARRRAKHKSNREGDSNNNALHPA